MGDERMTVSKRIRNKVRVGTPEKLRNCRGSVILTIGPYGHCGKLIGHLLVVRQEQAYAIAFDPFREFVLFVLVSGGLAQVIEYGPDAKDPVGLTPIDEPIPKGRTERHVVMIVLCSNEYVGI